MDKMYGNKWEGRKLDCTLTKEPQNYISHFVRYGVTVFKTQQSKPYKRFAVSKRKHSLKQNELVSTFTLKEYTKLY